jgi:hypothetical protein
MVCGIENGSNAIDAPTARRGIDLVVATGSGSWGSREEVYLNELSGSGGFTTRRVEDWTK